MRGKKKVKEGEKLLSVPVKKTASRGADDKELESSPQVLSAKGP
jgi:hypothetical protein